MDFTRISLGAGVLPEGPLWDHRVRRLYWVDINQGLLWCAWDGALPSVLWSDDDYLSGVWLAHGGRLVVAGGHGVHLISSEGDDLGPVPGAPNLERRMRFNDGAVDPQGRLVIGIMGRTEQDFSQPLGKLYRVDARGVCEELITGLTISNGVGWSPDGSRLYVADTIRRRVLNLPYPIQSMPLLADDCDAISLDVLPDGLTVRSDGTLVVACITAGQLLLLLPSGEVLDRVELPASCPTACCFGGIGMDRLFVTTSTHLLATGHTESESGHVLEGKGLGYGRPEVEFGGNV